jgi:hypothetical protein
MVGGLQPDPGKYWEQIFETGLQRQKLELTTGFGRW